MEVPLTAAQRERILAMRTARLSLVREQAEESRQSIPMLAAASACCWIAALLGAVYGGVGWVFACLGGLLGALFGWMVWVLVDVIRRTPAEAAAATAQVADDLSAGVAIRESFPVEKPWAFVGPSEDPDIPGPCLAFGLPSERRIFAHGPDESIRAWVHVYTLPTSRWRWTEEEGGPVKPVTIAPVGPDYWGKEPVLMVEWPEEEGPSWDTARRPD